MYGLIGSFRATSGNRDALLALLTEASRGMAGCLSYVIATDPADADRLWITEVWVDAEHHEASLSLPQVRGAITKAMPLIADFGEQIVTSPVSGVTA